MIGVQNLMKKHQALQAELAGHDSRIARVNEIGTEMINEGHFASEDIQQRLGLLNETWNNLKVSHATDLKKHL